MDTLLETPTVEWVLNTLEQADSHTQLGPVLAQMHAGEVANLLEAMPPEQRQALWEVILPEHEGEILTYLHEEARHSIIETMDVDELVAAAGQMEVADLADVIEELPAEQYDSILASLDQDRRSRLETVLAYEEDSAGRLMSTDVMSVRPDVSMAVVLRWLRRHDKLPPHTDALMVVDERGVYLGSLPMQVLVTAGADTLVETVLEHQSDAVNVHTSEHEVAALFNRRDLVSVAVVDDNQQLLGRITVDEVVEVIKTEAQETLMRSAGLDQEEDLFSPVVPSARRRGLWLGINLITVFMAAWVIGQFEEALDKIVALAVLMPVVASMGGIAGSQTLTLAIRGLALDQIAASNTRWLLMKEVAVAGLNGAVWAVVVAVVAYLWFNDPWLALIIAIALVLNLLAAAVSGIIIPLTLKRVGIDPALSGAVILTTVTDIMGFLSFLGLATVFLL